MIDHGPGIMVRWALRIGRSARVKKSGERYNGYPMVRLSPPSRGSKSDSRRQPPPDYFSRGVQIKILLLVFLFMTVLMLMNEARKPANWEWMWKSPGPAAAVGAGETQSQEGEAVRKTAADGPVDTRLPPESGMEESAPEPLVRAPGSPFSPEDLVTHAFDESLQTALQNGWSHVLGQLSRSEQELLAVGLWSRRHHPAPSAEQRGAWSELVARLARLWSDYQSQARLAVSDDRGPLTDAQRQLCLQILQASKEQWETETDALAAVTSPQSLTAEQDAARSRSRIYSTDGRYRRSRTIRSYDRRKTTRGFASGRYSSHSRRRRWPGRKDL